MRFFSALLLVAATLFLLAALALRAGNFLLNQQGAAERINAAVQRYAPGTDIAYDRAGFELSAQGAQMRLINFRVALDEGREISAAHVDVWLTRDAVYIQLEEAEIVLGDVSDLGGVAGVAPVAAQLRHSVVVSAQDARYRFGDYAGDSADINILRSGDGWRINISEQSEGRNLTMRAHLNHQGRGTLYAELFGMPPPQPSLAVWRDMRATVWADNAAAGVAYVAAGEADFPQLSVPLAAQTVSLRAEAEKAFWHAAGVLQRNASIFPAVTFSVRAQSLVVAPAVLPFPATVAAAGVWQRGSADGWSLNLGDIKISDNYATVAAVARVGDGGDGAHIQARGRLSDMPLSQVWRYAPAGEVRDWFASSLLDGRSRDAVFYLRAAAGLNPANLTVRLTAGFDQGVIDIDEGWPRARALNGVLVVNNDDIHIVGQGEFAELRAADVVARIPDAAAERATLYLDVAAVRDPVAAHVRSALRVRPIAAGVRRALDNYRVEEGDAAMALTLAVPLATPEDAAFHVNLSLSDSAVSSGEWAHLTNVRGVADIGNDGVRGRLFGRLRGMAEAPLTVNFNNAAVTVSGTADAAQILRFAGISAAVASGGINFQYVQSPQITAFNAPLHALAVNLPPPFAASANVSVRFVDADEYHMTYHNDAVTLRIVSVGGGVDAAFNAPSLPPPSVGINVHGEVGGVDLDDWGRYLAAAGGGTLGGLSLTLRAARMLGAQHDRVRLRLLPRGGYAAQVVSPYMRGGVTLRNGLLAGHFTHVFVPEDDDEATDGDNEFAADDDTAANGDGVGWGGERLTLSLVVESLQYGAVTLGRVDAAGVIDNEHWDISRLNISNGQTMLSLSGVYEGGGTFLTTHLSAPDMPEFLRIFNVNEGLTKGGMSLFGQIGWRGRPTQFRIAALEGGVRLRGSDMRFSDIKTSTRVINFLSVFSPQSLFSLGFTELAQPAGVEFSDVSGNVRLRDGVAEVDAIQLVSSDLQMNIHGETDYIKRAHDLRGRVRPGEKLLSAGSAISLGVTAVNPLSLVAGALFGKLFEEPISEIGAYEYTITGSWDEPQYKEIGTTGVDNVGSEG